MNVQIKQAGASDAASVALLGRVTFAETFGQLFTAHPGDLRNYLDRTFGVAKIERSLGNPANLYWLVFADRLPVGYAKLKYPSALPGHADHVAAERPTLSASKPRKIAAPKLPKIAAAQLQKIYVLREFVGQGLGRDLFCEVEHAATVCASLLWLDVLQANERAIVFYRTHGFAAVGDDTYAIGAQRFPFHLMAKRLP